MSTPDPIREAEQKLDDNYNIVKAGLSAQQRSAIKAYKEVLGFLGVDVLNDPTNPVLSADRAITDSSYLSLQTPQLMYYIGVLCGIRPYLCEELIDAKARAVYSTVWKKFNEVGFKISFRKDALRKEIEKVEKKIKDKAIKTPTGIKKHFTEDSLKDEASWRTYTWSKIEGEKIRKAELLTQYVNSIDSLIVALKERIRYTNPEGGQAKFGDNTNFPMP